MLFQARSVWIMHKVLLMLHSPSLVPVADELNPRLDFTLCEAIYESAPITYHLSITELSLI
ncbi:MAG: hypothetical protein AB8U91_03875 [Candidatus Midichloria sp.]